MAHRTGRLPSGVFTAMDAAMIVASEELPMRLPVSLSAIIICLIASGCGSDRSTTGTAPTSPATASAGGDTTPAPTAAAPAAPAASAGAALPIAINTIDPVDGLPVDPSIAPIIVAIDVVSPPLTVAVGISSAENGKRIQADPEKYAGAALHNRVARIETDTLLPH